jgi:hypothetical protein
VLTVFETLMTDVAAVGALVVIVLDAQTTVLFSDFEE